MIKPLGLTDLQQCFFLIFWQDIGSFVTRAIYYSYEQNIFSEQNKLGISMITCISKAGTPKQYLKNIGDLLISLM